MEYPGRIELTEEICGIIDNCPRQKYLPNTRMGEICSDNCPLFGACLERLTGDDSENK